MQNRQAGCCHPPVAAHRLLPVLGQKVKFLRIHLDGHCCLRPPGIGSGQELPIEKERRVVERNRQIRTPDQIAQVTLGGGVGSVRYLGQDRPQQCVAGATPFPQFGE